MRHSYDPAGHDHALRSAVQDLRAHRWSGARDLMEITSGPAWAQRTYRSQVLAAAAAESTVIDSWATEDPTSYTALLLRARVAVHRALRAARIGDPQAWQWEEQARRFSLKAAHAWADDPVPWVCLLALAQLDVHCERPEHRERPAEVMLPRGPWKLLDEAHRRDPFNREAYHRALQFVRSIRPPAYDFGSWIASHAPAGSPLHLLPLYASVQQKNLQESNAAWRYEWSQEGAQHTIQQAYHWWFLPNADRRTQCVVEDLSHLALSLWASRQFEQANRVFTAMTPYAAPEPWRTVAGGNEHEAARLLEQARVEAQNIARGREGHQAPPSRPARGFNRLFGGSSA
ncbi:hypothetical protein [Streptomyces sp. NBC_00470]|uniref:hypothetical protein n=1 Tax=Streptomyces sp. NBC_00470 TaxID=2975753 RepID=UPI002F907DF5